MAVACIHLGVRTFQASRECMLEADRGDLKTVWDALASSRALWIVTDVLTNGTLTGDPISLEMSWNTEEEREREWRGLQVGIKPFFGKSSQMIVL